MIRALLRVRRMGPAVAVVGLTVIIGIFFLPEELPGIFATSMQGAWFNHLVLVPGALLPIAPSFGVLERTLARGVVERIARAAASSCLLGAGMLILITQANTPAAIYIWAVLLAALGFALAHLWPDAMVLGPIAAGLGSIALEHAVFGSHPVSAAMVSLGLTRAVGLLLLAQVLWVLGPSVGSTRSSTIGRGRFVVR